MYHRTAPPHTAALTFLLTARGWNSPGDLRLSPLLLSALRAVLCAWELRARDAHEEGTQRPRGVLALLLISRSRSRKSKPRERSSKQARAKWSLHLSWPQVNSRKPRLFGAMSPNETFCMEGNVLRRHCP